MIAKYISLVLFFVLSFFNLNAHDNPMDISFQIKGKVLEIVVDGVTGKNLVYKVEISKNGKDFFSLGSLQNRTDCMSNDLPGPMEGVSYIRVEAYGLQTQPLISKIKTLLLDTSIIKTTIQSNSAGSQFYM